MGYRLGVDLGTTYTAAAVFHDRPEIVALGNRSAEVPSVVFLREDGTFMVGEPAELRGAVAPQRLAREFKRRIGDDKPYFLAGSPFSAHALTAKLLRWVVDRVGEREGGSPDHVVVTHPANWGPHKREMLEQAAARAGLDHVRLATEPECAALRYAAMRPMEPGAVVAVYDLGGGTFDTAVLTRTAEGFSVLGAATGIEQLGGVDFDEAILRHVLTGLDVDPDELDLDDHATRVGHARLRRECVLAKEALSHDTEVFVSVGLPDLHTDVRVTRGEFEDLIRPSVADTVAELRRALRGAQVTPEDLTAVLLAGGSSRIPLVTELLSAELGRPVAIDAHPKHLVAMGAALLAAPASVPEQPAQHTPAVSSPGRWRGSTRLKPKRPAAAVATPPQPAPTDGPAGPAIAPAGRTRAATDPYPESTVDRAEADDGTTAGTVGAATSPAASTSGGLPPDRADRRPSRRDLVLGGVLAVVLLGAGTALAIGLDDDEAGDTVTAAECPASEVVPSTDELPNGRISLIHRREAAVDTWVSRQDGSQVVHQSRHTDDCYPYSEGRWLQSDVDGDGEPDVVHVRNGMLSTWLSRSPSTLEPVDFRGDDPSYVFTDGQWKPQDVDGDGRVDLTHVTTTGVTTWTSQGDGTYTVGEPASSPGYPYLEGQWLDTTGADASTLFHVTGQGVHAWSAGRDGELTPTRLPELRPDYDYLEGLHHTGDLNGDEVPDLVHVRADGLTTWESSANGSYAVHDDDRLFGSEYDFFSGTWRTGDVTGDGRDEFLHLFGGGVNTWGHAGSGDYRLIGPSLHFPPPDHVSDTVDWRVREVTGDGKDDLLLVWHEGVDAWVSEGGGRYRRVTHQVDPVEGQEATYPYREGEWF